jgi:hypothetical protein
MNPRYQEWLKHVFDHEVRKRAWYFDDEKPEFEASPIEMTELIGQTFLCAGKDLAGYTDEKVDQGIWYFAGMSGSDFMFELKSPEVPLTKRLEAIGNIFYLYSDCFAKRCAETLGHLSEEGSALNPSCYMFWDISPITLFWDKNPFTYLENPQESKQTQGVVLNVLEKILNIEHRACREGALHGLRHIAYSCPENVREIIDSFLCKNKPDEKLLAYALKAREGNVL